MKTPSVSTEKKLLRIAFTVGILASALARGEAGGYSGLSGQTILRPGQKAGDLVKAIANDGKHLTDPGTIIDNSAMNAANGREYKAADAQRQANAGKKAAMSAGTALTATAIPMVMSPIPSVKAAGMALLAKAALEFKQAGESGKVAAQNGDQKDLLKRNDGQGGSQTAANDTAGEIAKAIQTPEFNKALGENGINSDDFASRLANGSFSNSSDVARALGSSLSDEEMAKGAVLADRQMGGSAGPETSTPEEVVRVGADDGALRNPNASGDGEGMGTGVSRGVASEGANAILGTLAAPDASGSSAGSEAGAAGSESGQAGLDGASAALGSPGKALGLGSDIAHSMLGHFGLGSGAVGEAGAVPTRAQLESIGIVRSAGRQTVFQIGSRNFRSYQKWRKQKRLARR